MIHDISLETDDDILHIGDEVNIYPVFLSWTTIILETFLFARKDNCFRPYFCQSLVI